ncbi:MAG: uracil-DNA glycosylase [Deltaproteobacteria bacterium]|nr:uracil-DNA glycosylase [Deltaproteobacteria bacterium]
MADRRPQLPEDWLEALAPEFERPYMQELRAFLVEEKRRFRVFPPGPEIFAAMNHAPLSKVRVVILGQDPYHGAGQAHGLCFSVREGVDIPPSLANIYKELHADLGIPPASHGNLSRWAEQGVLLLNATLTVRENQANSHKGHGWESFTDAVVSAVASRREGIAFVLWGRSAADKAAKVDLSRHFVVKSPHPSPLSAHAGFFGSRPFSRVNAHLRGRGEPEIDWRV